MPRNHLNKRSLDLGSLIGTAMSLVAFLVMGLLVHEQMWRAKALDQDQPELEKADTEPAPAQPSSPRKTNSKLRMIA